MSLTWNANYCNSQVELEVSRNFTFKQSTSRAYYDTASHGWPIERGIYLDWGMLEPFVLVLYDCLFIYIRHISTPCITVRKVNCTLQAWHVLAELLSFWGDERPCYVSRLLYSQWSLILYGCYMVHYQGHSGSLRTFLCVQLSKRVCNTPFNPWWMQIVAYCIHYILTL